MEDKDFRPGDLATFINSERGVARGRILTNDVPGSDIVRFKADDSMSVYAVYKNGKLSKYGGPCVLYHGHNVQVQITGEEIPKRVVKRYVNLYSREKYCVNSVQSRFLHSTKEDAQNNVSPICTLPLAIGVEIEIPEDMV